VRKDDWNQRWKSIGPERRRRILRAVYRGEEVGDPRDASLAVELVDRRKAVAVRYIGSRWLSARHILFFTGLGLTLSFATGDLQMAALGLLLALYLLSAAAFFRHLQARATRARERNERLTRLL
jgi:hypothetical protein